MAENDNVYAGFWKRFAAYIIDGMILVFISYPIYEVIKAQVLILMYDSREIETLTRGYIYFILTMLFNTWAYYAGMESSPLQATVGKLAVGIRVVSRDGSRLSIAKATGRFLGKFISGLLFGYGYLMAGFRQKQALHDIMVGAIVVDRSSSRENPGAQGPRLTKETHEGRSRRSAVAESVCNSGVNTEKVVEFEADTEQTRQVAQRSEDERKRREQTWDRFFDGHFLRDPNTDIILEAATELEWQVGPSKCMTYFEAVEWINGLGQGWRLPTREELMALYKAGIRCSAWFSKWPEPFERAEGGTWVWSGEERDSSIVSVWGFGFKSGREGWNPRSYSDQTRTFAVRPL